MPASPGKSGYCKICSDPNAHIFIRGAREGGKKGDGWNSAEAQEAGEVYGLTFNRSTWYDHVKHVKAQGTGAVLQAADKARREMVVATRREMKTNPEVLEAIRDIGMQRALENPDLITPDHALKAIQIMESRKDKSQDHLAVLVQFVVGAPPPVVIEGTARDVDQEVAQ